MERKWKERTRKEEEMKAWAGEGQLRGAREITKGVRENKICTRSLVPRRSLLPVVRAKSGKVRARERLANIGKIPLILAQFYPWSHFTSFYSSIFEKLLADSMDVSVEVSANSGKF